MDCVSVTREELGRYDEYVNVGPPSVVCDIQASLSTTLGTGGYVVVECMKETFRTCTKRNDLGCGVKKSSRNPFNRERMALIDKVVIVASSPKMLSTWTTLDVPHFMLHWDDDLVNGSYTKGGLETYLRDFVHPAGVEVEFIGPDVSSQPRASSFGNVYRSSSLNVPTTNPLSSPLTIRDLAEQVLLYGKGDSSRDNKFLDVGWNSDRSSANRDAVSGIAHPSPISEPTDTGYKKELMHMACGWFSDVARVHMPPNVIRQR